MDVKLSETTEDTQGQSQSYTLFKDQRPAHRDRSRFRCREGPNHREYRDF